MVTERSRIWRRIKQEDSLYPFGFPMRPFTTGHNESSCFILCLGKGFLITTEKRIKKMSEIVIFENAEFGKIRTIIIENEPWFVATDIAFALGYEKPNNAVNTHCKKINKFNYPETGQPLNIIAEA